MSCESYSDDGIGRSSSPPARALVLSSALSENMVDVKFCIVKLDGTSEYRRVAVPLLNASRDLLAILREKLQQFFPELSNDVDLEFQYEGQRKRSKREREREKRVSVDLDDVRGLVVARSSEGIGEAARDQSSRHQLLRVFVKFLSKNKITPVKHLGVICDGSFDDELLRISVSLVPRLHSISDSRHSLQMFAMLRLRSVSIVCRLSIDSLASRSGQDSNAESSKILSALRPKKFAVSSA